jgi:hypothetical protein
MLFPMDELLFKASEMIPIPKYQIKYLIRNIPIHSRNLPHSEMSEKISLVQYSKKFNIQKPHCDVHDY